MTTPTSEPPSRNAVCDGDPTMTATASASNGWGRYLRMGLPIPTVLETRLWSSLPSLKSTTTGSIGAAPPTHKRSPAVIVTIPEKNSAAQNKSTTTTTSSSSQPQFDCTNDVVSALRKSADLAKGTDSTLVWRDQMLALCCCMHPRVGANSTPVRALIMGIECCGLGNVAEIVKAVGALLKPPATVFVAGFSGDSTGGWCALRIDGCVSRLAHRELHSHSKVLGSISGRLMVLQDEGGIGIWDLVTGQMCPAMSGYPQLNYLYDAALWLPSDLNSCGRLVICGDKDVQQIHVCTFLGSCVFASLPRPTSEACYVAWMNANAFVCVTETEIALCKLKQNWASSSILNTTSPNVYIRQFMPYDMRRHPSIHPLAILSGSTTLSLAVLYRQYHPPHIGMGRVYLFTGLLNESGSEKMLLAESVDTIASYNGRVIAHIQQTTKALKSQIAIFDGRTGDRLISVLSPQSIEQLSVCGNVLAGIHTGNITLWNLSTLKTTLKKKQHKTIRIQNINQHNFCFSLGPIL
ncbi:hypothetical protein Pelo_8401 [Pelomyxa schiedti]|nr:hypothetical protein Pelo_8401 [Pelomyxa schiedti]